LLDKIDFACDLALIMNGELNTMFNVKIALLKLGYLRDIKKELAWVSIVALRFKKSHAA